MDAHSFNFVIDDLEPGVHTVAVYAEIETDSSAQEGSASATAFIGKGSLSVEEVRFIKDENLVMQ